RFAEKGQGGPGTLISGGVYAFGRGVLDLIPEGRAVSLEHEVFPALVGKGFYGLPSRSYFVDMGIPEDYLGLVADPDTFMASLA
ncbi:MAG TPA: hypothetical protein VG013_01420, partial [Gemmataceae bacterium]|nr:hypothetical protein [Gemmataceae bacterium]